MHLVLWQNVPSFSINHVVIAKRFKILSSVSYQCNDVMANLYIGFVEVTDKENSRETFLVVVVVWISIAVLPVKII